MINIISLTVSEYFDLENPEEKSQYDFAMKYAFRFTDPDDEYKVGDLMEQPFGFIKDLQFDVERGAGIMELIDHVLTVTGLETLKDEPLDKYCRFANYLLASTLHLLDIEQQTLSYDPTDQEMTAGMDRFKDLGIYLQIRSIALTFGISPQRVRRWKYSDAFVELYTTKQLKEYEQDVRKLERR